VNDAKDEWTAVFELIDRDESRADYQLSASVKAALLPHQGKLFQQADRF
jgi:hypothetical protein